MFEIKSKRVSRNGTATVTGANNNNSQKPDDENEHVNISKKNSIGINNNNNGNGNTTIPHVNKNGSSRDVSKPSKKNARTEENAISISTKRVFAEIARKKVDKKRPNESSASSISKSDVSKKSDEFSGAKSKVIKRPKYHVKKNEKVKLQEDVKADSPGTKDKNDQIKATPIEGTSKSHASSGCTEKFPPNGDKEPCSGLGTPTNENNEDKGDALVDPNNESKDETADGLSIQGTVTSNTSSSSFQPAPTLVENSKPAKKSWSSILKSWSACLTSKLNTDLPSQLDDSDQNSSEKSINKIPEVPDIPTQYRPKEINGFGMFSKSQSMPIETKKNYQKLLSTSLELILEFCRYLEILNERSGKQDIQDAFLIQFGRFHSGLPFTETKGSEALNEEELVQLSNLFNDIYHDNNTIWIANKFEYTSFSRKFRRAIADTLESDYQIRISYKKTLFARQVICASLIQWKRNIPFT